MGKDKGKSGIGSFIWNSETKEFIGRDGGSWAKITLFYAIFYTCLASFFVGMLAVFFQIMPKDVPMYYGESGTMNARVVNPGLGFRPQVDVEDMVIHYKPNEKASYEKYSTALSNFLNAKYSDEKQQGAHEIDCEDGNQYIEDLKSGKVCKFNYKKSFETTECTETNDFGYKTNKACVLIKLNKIVSWLPDLEEGKSYIKVNCSGEFSADDDNIRSVIYHSEDNLNNKEEGKISSKYFPYFAQKGYKAPFIFIQADVTPNTVVNVVCKAYAKNIDSDDRMNRRGQTRFNLFITQNDRN